MRCATGLESPVQLFWAFAQLSIRFLKRLALAKEGSMERNRQARSLLAMETPQRLLVGQREEALLRLVAALLARLAMGKQEEAGDRDEPDHA